MIGTLRRRACAATVVLLALVAGGPVQAHGPDPVLSDNLFAQDQRLEFRWRSGAEPLHPSATAPTTSEANNRNRTAPCEVIVIPFRSSRVCVHFKLGQNVVRIVVKAVLHELSFGTTAL